jgi:hypothetical protein
MLRLAERLLASPEGLCPLELVGYFSCISRGETRHLLSTKCPRISVMPSTYLMSGVEPSLEMCILNITKKWQVRVTAA